MVNYACLFAGIGALIIGVFFLFTSAGNEFLSPLEHSDDMVGVTFYMQFIPYTLFLAGVALVARGFMDRK